MICSVTFTAIGQAFSFDEGKMPTQEYSFVDPDNLVWSVKISDDFLKISGSYVKIKKVKVIWGDSLLIIDPATGMVTQVTIDPHGDVIFYFNKGILVVVDIGKADFFDDFGEMKLLEIRWNLVPQKTISLSGNEGLIGNSLSGSKVLHQVAEKALSPLGDKKFRKTKKRKKRKK